MGRFNFAQYQSGVRKLVVRQCQQQADLEILLQEMHRVTDDAEGIIEEHQTGDRSLIDCGPGCSSCCVVNVSTLIPEGFVIVRYLKNQGAQTVEQISARLERLWREVRGLDDDDRLFLRRNCSFLDANGCCLIYPVRPILCRSVTSTDVKSCAEALAGKVLGVEKAVLMHQFQHDLYETLFAGIGAGLAEGGVDGRSFQLTGLVRYLLRHTDAESQWLAGQRLTWQDIY